MILCNASMKRNGQWATTYTLLYTYTDIAKINLQGRFKLTIFVPISCLIRSCHHLDFLNIVASTNEHHSLNVRTVINWKRNFKENITKKYLGERITKEVVIIRIESYFSAFH